MGKYNISVSFSGVGNNPDIHDGKMKISYLYVLNKEEENLKGKDSYKNLLNNYNFTREDSPILINYEQDKDHSPNEAWGVYPTDKGGNLYTVYRREYQEFSRYSLSSRKIENKTYTGDWEPVAINNTNGIFRDFNVSNDRNYQYIIYSATDNNKSRMANSGEPVHTHWNCWSLTELIPVKTELDAPIVTKSYKVDMDNIWLFKYNLETGSQTQNITKNEIQTLGQFNRVSQTPYNSISGEVSCMLGSEIIPYGVSYIERRYQAYDEPLTTNERVEMLKQWRKMLASKNPKLLKDMKGQSWIVQVFSSSNTPKNNVRYQPDQISFTWKQIGATDNVTIVGEGYEINRGGEANSDWKVNEKIWR